MPWTLGGDEVEHVELAAGVREEPREVAHALEVSDTQRTTLEHQRPVVPLATGDADARGRLLIRWREVDPFEDVTRRLQLHGGLPLAAAGGEGVGETHACDRRLIGRPDLVPESHGFREELFRGRRIALGQAYPPASEARARDECLAVESVGHELQLVGGCAGSIDVAGCDLDLDLRLEQRCPLQLGVWWQLLRGDSWRTVERVLYEGRRGGDVSSRQLDERETGLRIPPGLMRGQQRLLGSVDVSFPQPDPAELGQGPSELASQVRAELLARCERFAFRLVQRSAQPEDLRAMDSAAPVEAADGVGLAPPLHRLRPFLGGVVLCESLEGADELAVDEAGRERIEVVGDHRDAHFVEERETFVHVAAQDEEPRLGHPPDSEGRRVAPLTDLDGASGPVAGAPEVARQQSLVRPDGRKPGVRRRLILIVEQALRACQPAAHRSHERGVEKQVHGDANRCASRGNLVARLHARRMRAFPRLDRHVEVAGGVGDLAEQRQVGTAQEAARVRLHQEVERLLPLSTRCRVPGLLSGGFVTGAVTAVTVVLTHLV